MYLGNADIKRPDFVLFRFDLRDGLSKYFDSYKDEMNVPNRSNGIASQLRMF